jgi:hypothetical protein
MNDEIPTAAQLRDDLRHRIATLERERDEARAAYCEAKVQRDEARELLREIAACSDEHVGLNYVTKQIPTYFLIRIGNAIKVLEINQ